MNEKYRVGTGFDIHKLVDNRPLILAGVRIPHTKGLFGHSDADVVVHAVIDALLGALAQGDIGTHFPDTDLRYKDADSMVLLKQVFVLVSQSRYKISNLDITVFAQAPKLNEHITQMRGSINNAFGTHVSQISIKAKTMEGLGPVGEGKAIEACATVLLEKM